MVIADIEHTAVSVQLPLSQQKDVLHGLFEIKGRRQLKAGIFAQSMCFKKALVLTSFIRDK